MGSVYKQRGLAYAAALVAVLAGYAPQASAQPIGEMVGQQRPTADVWVNNWRYDQSPRAVLTPNMFGDFTVNRPVGFTTGGLVGPTTTPGSTRVLTGQLFQSVGGQAPFTAVGGTNVLQQGSADLLFLGQLAPNTNFTSTTTFNGPLPANVGLNNSAAFQAFVLQTFGLPGERIQFNQGASTGTLVGADYFLSLSYSLITDPTTTGGGANPQLVLGVSNPVGGGMVGRTKVSNGNSPLPRDRVIYDYDYLSNTPLLVSGARVSRQNVGFEKAFFDGLASLSVQLPFASTVSEYAPGGLITGGATQLGNLFLTTKVLLASTQDFSLSTGLGVSLPTASDTRIGLGGIRDAIRLRNDTTLLVPYIALLLTPSDRLFAQFWGQCSFDTIGNRVTVNNGNGAAVAGKLNDPALLGLDAQIGYWLLHPASSREGACFRGVAPFLELHYNSTVGDNDLVRTSAFVLTDAANRFDDLSITIGATAQLYNSVYLSGGLNKSIRGGNNRNSDYNLGVRCTWYFGQTAGAREEAVPTF